MCKVVFPYCKYCWNFNLARCSSLCIMEAGDVVSELSTVQVHTTAIILTFIIYIKKMMQFDNN